MQKKIILLLAFCCLNVACAKQVDSTGETLEVPQLLYLKPEVKTQAQIAEEKKIREARVLKEVTPTDLWQVRPGLLREQLEGWAAAAGYQVVWKVSHDYHLQSFADFQGDLVDALSSLFTGLQQRGNTFQVTVYSGNRVILVSED